MKPPRLSRRKFLATTLLAAPCLTAADATLIEPTWLDIRRLTLGSKAPTHRLVHFSDVHHKGDCAYLKSVIATINSLKPDFVCFTGDIMEEGKYLEQALELMAGVRAPMFGVPGNHDYYSQVPFAPIRECFQATGGDWLLNQSRPFDDGKINLVGTICLFPLLPVPPTRPETKNILLTHYPASVKRVGDRQFDLMLAGHSHGGQVRLPFIGAPVLPGFVDQYDLGLFQTPNGPLYVNPGIGYIGPYDIRFNCRPEITVIEI